MAAKRGFRDATSRSSREADFHDRRFADSDGIRPASRFYALTGPSRGEFNARNASLPAGCRVLELGCGPDSVAWDLIERGFDVTGIDISAQAIDRARREAVRRDIDPSRFVVMNAEALEFPAGSFDAIIGSSILHHLDLEASLRGIRRVLGPGGRALFYEPSGRNPMINAYRRLTPQQRSLDERPLTDADLRLLRRTFDHIRLDHFHLMSLAALALLQTRFFASVSERLERIDQSVFRRIPRLRGLAWIIVIEARVAEQRDVVSPKP